MVYISAEERAILTAVTNRFQTVTDSFDGSNWKPGYHQPNGPRFDWFGTFESRRRAIILAQFIDFTE